MPLPEPAHPADPRAPTLWRIQGLVRWALFWLPVSVGVGVGVGVSQGLILGLVCGAALALAQLGLALFWPSLVYAHFRYELREHDLLVQRGVLLRHWSSVPYGRIQHVDTRQGPLERALGLARLHVFTASGMGADGSIGGLATAEAERLRDLLSRRGGDDGV